MAHENRPSAEHPLGKSNASKQHRLPAEAAPQRIVASIASGGLPELQDAVSRELQQPAASDAGAARRAAATTTEADTRHTTGRTERRTCLIAGS
jgi:hypothetical protein